MPSRPSVIINIFLAWGIISASLLAQTSGGLLISVPSETLGTFEAHMQQSGLFYATIGKITEQSGTLTLIP